MHEYWFQVYWQRQGVTLNKNFIYTPRNRKKTWKTLSKILADGTADHRRPEAADPGGI